MIKKTSRGWEVIAHRSGRCLGIYKTRQQAESRLKQIKMFQERFKKMVSKRKSKHRRK